MSIDIYLNYNLIKLTLDKMVLTSSPETLMLELLHNEFGITCMLANIRPYGHNDNNSIQTAVL